MPQATSRPVASRVALLRTTFADGDSGRRCNSRMRRRSTLAGDRPIDIPAATSLSSTMHTDHIHHNHAIQTNTDCRRRGGRRLVRRAAPPPGRRCRDFRLRAGRRRLVRQLRPALLRRRRDHQPRAAAGGHARAVPRPVQRRGSHAARGLPHRSPEADHRSAERSRRAA